MKRILITLAIIVAALVVALALFIATFNADRYRPMVETRLQAALGRPVRLEHIRLGWRGGLAVQLKGVTIPSDDPAEAEPLVAIDVASGILRLLPLLQRRVEIASIYLSGPRVHFARDAAGRIHPLGLAPINPAVEGAMPPHPVPPSDGERAGASGPSGVGGLHAPAPASGSAPAIAVHSLVIERGQLRWTDAAAQPPTDVVIRGIELTHTQPSSGRQRSRPPRGPRRIDRDRCRPSH